MRVDLPRQSFNSQTGIKNWNTGVHACMSTMYSLIVLLIMICGDLNPYVKHVYVVYKVYSKEF